MLTTTSYRCHEYSISSTITVVFHSVKGANIATIPCATRTADIVYPLLWQELQPYAKLDRLARCIRVLPDCSVYSEGYAATLAFTCSQCSEGNMAGVVVVLAIAILAALAFVWHMVAFIEQENTARSVFVRVGKVLPLQSIKIVIVAWQIVIQGNTCVVHTF